MTCRFHRIFSCPATSESSFHEASGGPFASALILAIGLTGAMATPTLAEERMMFSSLMTETTIPLRRRANAPVSNALFIGNYQSLLGSIRVLTADRRRHRMAKSLGLSIAMDVNAVEVVVWTHELLAASGDTKEADVTVVPSARSSRKPWARLWR